MRRILILTTCSIALLTTSCGENKTADSHEQTPLAAPEQPVAKAQVKESGKPAPAPKQNKATAANNDPTAPPADAQFTIVCKVMPGPGHVERATQLKDELIKSTGMRGWYLTHAEDQSTLYYGYYKTLDEPKYKADREWIASLQTQIGDRPFRDAMPGPINAPDPTAPPEFNLVNARGFWSLQIAAYQGPGRKEAAVESVRDARKSGVEAYYFHGPNVSSVCIGSWPEEAIRKQEFDGGGGVDVRDQQRPLLFLGPGAEIPPAIKEQYSKNLIDKESGRQVQVVEQKVEVIDPTMRAMMETYKTHSVNGVEEVTEVTDKTTGKKYLDHKPSLIVPIPHTASVLKTDPGYTPGLLAPGPMAPRGSGQLRTIGQ